MTEIEKYLKYKIKYENLKYDINFKSIDSILDNLGYYYNIIKKQYEIHSGGGNDLRDNKLNDKKYYKKYKNLIKSSAKSINYYKNIFKREFEQSFNINKLFKQSLLKNNTNLNSAILKSLDDAAAFNQTYGIVKKGLMNLQAARGEAAIEGAMVGVEVENELKKQYSDPFGNFIGDEETLNKIKNTSREAAHTTASLNTPLIFLSNSISLGAFVKPTKAAARSFDKAISKEYTIGIIFNSTYTIKYIKWF
jgi:hypothetical protein